MAQAARVSEAGERGAQARALLVSAQAEQGQNTSSQT